MTILAVPAASTGLVTASRWVRHLCPHVPEVDEGRVAITWRCDGDTIELHSLSAYLDEWAACRISHEEIVARIASDIARSGRVTDVRVVGSFNTAGIEVEVTCAVPNKHVSSPFA